MVTSAVSRIDSNSVHHSLEKDSSDASYHSQPFLDLLETQSEHVMAPSPRMWPALLRVYEDRIIRVTLLKREDERPANLFPSRNAISTARVLLLSAVLASGSALSTKTAMSSLRALPLCALVHNAFELGAPKQFVPASSAPGILQGLSLIFRR